MVDSQNQDKITLSYFKSTKQHNPSSHPRNDALYTHFISP